MVGDPQTLVAFADRQEAAAPVDDDVVHSIDKRATPKDVCEVDAHVGVGEVCHSKAGSLGDPGDFMP